MRRFLGLVLAAGLLLAGCGDDDPDSKGTGSGSLFVQTAEGGAFSRTGDRAKLRLHPASAVTTTFADRPARSSHAIPTARFIAGFDRNFAGDSPNATLSSLERGRGEFPVELSRPSYDERRRNLTYAVRPIGIAGSKLPSRLGPVSLFIDAAGSDAAKKGFLVLIADLEAREAELLDEINHLYGLLPNGDAELLRELERKLEELYEVRAKIDKYNAIVDGLMESVGE